VAAVVAALALGTAAAVYRQQQRQRGREQAETGLIRAAELRQGYRFRDAEAMLDQVRGWVRQAVDRELETRLHRADVDLALARDLDDVRQKAATRVDEKWDAARGCAEYRKVFAWHRFDVLASDIDELARTIRGSAAREDIVAALDDWARVESDAKRRRRLLRLANGADEPGPWRQAVRQALAQQDRKQFRQLVRNAETGKPTPALVLLLAGEFSPKSDEPTALLRRMQRERPGDFWISIALGRRLTEQGRYQEAAESALACVALRPDSAVAYYNLGLDRHHTGEVEEAMACYRKAIQLDPRYAPAHTNLGIALVARGKVDLAIASYQRAIAIDPRLAPAHSNLGAALVVEGKVDEAIKYFRRAIESDPRSLEAHTNLGFALWSKGKLDEAIEWFRRAIAIDRNCARAYVGLGNALYNKGKVDEAIASYRKALDLDPKLAPAHVDLGRALKDKRKVDEAITCFRKAIALDPKLANAHFGLGVALSDKGKVDEAIAAFSKAIQLEPNFAPSHFNLGNALKAKGKVDEAITCYRRAITLDPRNAPAHGNLAGALYGKKMVDEAIASLRIAIQLDPTDARIYYNLGVCLHGKGELVQAIACYRKAIQLGSTDARAHYNLGNALRTEKKPDEAIACYLKAIQLEPRFVLAHTNLGIALRGKGKVEEAIACFHKAIDLDPRYAQAYGALGETLMQQGQLPEAQKYLHLCQALLPAGHSVRRYNARLLQQCEQWLDTDGKLQAFLAGKGAPTDAAAQVQMAALAQQPFNRHYLTAARLYRDAFARQLPLADRHRYNAACAAALAGTGQGKDAAKLNDTDRALWRQHSRDWLRAELARLDKALDRANAQARVEIAQRLQRWQSDPDLAGVRDRGALDTLPEAERQPWLTLWTDVALLDRATATR
jgi:superkiller protein 3